MFLENRHLFFGRGIADFDLQKKTVELRFGKRIGAFELDRILGGKNGEALSDSAWRSPSIVTWRSSIDSSNAAWVRGGIRLISSTSSRSVNIGPR